MFEMIHLSDHFVSGLLFSVRIGGSLVLRKTMGVHGSEKHRASDLHKETLNTFPTCLRCDWMILGLYDWIFLFSKHEPKKKSCARAI